MEKASPSKFSSVWTPVLVIGLVGMAFGLGVLFQKVQYLEKGGAVAGTAANPQAAQAPTAAAPAPAAPAPLDAQGVAKLASKGFSKGNQNAKVTVVEFADFQCPFCERLFTQVLPQLTKDYIDTGKVRFVYRDYAFLGQESMWAAEAARCANDQGKYWEYHDYLFNHQGQENSGAFSKANLEKFAATLGLNTSQFNSCLESDKYASAVAQDLQDGQGVGVNGTPATFVNGTLLSGAQPYTSFQSAIDSALASAK